MKLVMRAAYAAGILATGLALSTGAVNAQTKIGALYPFSGGLALLGDESFRGLELATEERNAAGGVKGQPLQIVKGDAVDPNQAVGEARRLTSVDKVTVVFGTYSSSLSGGEQQMVAIARGLMASPRMLMLDEPSLGLAPIIVGQMFDIVEKIRGMGTTVLLVEQKAFHALKIAERAYVIENGMIVRENTGVGMLSDPHVKTAYLGI
ncbi:MAG: ABC transporter substrate-binding protein [Hyphomicrobiales bacterium]|nr:ABC transporter substrate-binding protein [Hyphomicrobiales bacterium]